MQCLLLIATLCFSDVERVEVSPPSSMSRWATAHVLSGDVQLLLSSDNPRGELDARLMHRACADGACVTYYKWCEAGARFTCYFSTGTSEYSEWLRVSAPDNAAYKEIEARLGLVGRPLNAIIPLSNLNVISASRNPPFCRRGGRGPQCPR